MIKLNKDYYTFNKSYGFVDIVTTEDSPVNDDLQTRAKSEKHGWTSNFANSELFETKPEAINARNQYELKQISDINRDIQSVEELIRFALHGHGDMPIVQRAVRKKADELGLDSSVI